MSKGEEPARGPTAEASEIISRDTPVSSSTPTSRRDRRQARKRRTSVASLNYPVSKTKSDSEPTKPITPRACKASSKDPNFQLSSTTVSTSSIPILMSAARKNIPLLVASIGNPEAVYGNTLHSAGHNVLNEVSNIRSFAPFKLNKRFGAQVSEPVRTTSFSIIPFRNRTTEVEVPDNWILWKSPSLMNVSGKAVRSAWDVFRRDNPQGLLVLVHDELEKPRGVVTVKRGGSHKGHNGIRSVMAAMAGTPFVKVGVGIGRPLSREPADVARYVLQKMNTEQARAIQAAAGPVIEALREIAEGKK